MSSATSAKFLLDVNVFIALAWPRHIHHRRAHSWWATIETWATTPFTEAAFLRLSTNQAVVGQSVSMVDALSMLASVRGSRGHAFVGDDTSLAESKLNLSRVVTSRQVTDAHLVNLAANHALVLATLDRGIPEMLAVPDRIHVLVLPDTDPD
ncbi:MAG: TA system VapC family ribonuclease toxin [Pseudolysinimonas sp.]